MRQRTELHTYSKEDILSLCAAAAKLSIVGSYFVGRISDPIASFLPDGSVEVKTLVEQEN